MKMTNPILAKIMPYLMMALMCVLFIVSFFIFWYVFLIVIAIGLILFLIGFVRAKLFHHKKTTALHEAFIIDIQKENNSSDTPEKIGRIIEHDEHEQ